MSLSRIFKNYKITRNYCTSINVVHSRVPNMQLKQCLLHEYIFNKLNKWHNKRALICAETGRYYTYEDVYKKSLSVGTFLRKRIKLQVFDTIAILLPNVPEYAIIALGATQYGLKVTTINPIYTTDEIKRQLVNSDVKALFTLTDLYDAAYKAIQLAKKEIPIIIIKDKQNISNPEKGIKFEEIATTTPESSKDHIDLEDVAFLPYSSGTTGLPKGVQLTHRNVISNLQQIVSPEFKLNLDTEGNQQDVVPIILPMYHIYGLCVILLNMLSQGCLLVTVPKFSTQAFIKVLEIYKPDILYAVPPIILMLLNNENIKSSHLESLRQLVCAASPIGVSDIERFHKKTKGTKNLMQIYGMTETSPIVLHQSNVLTNGIKVGACGLLVPNTVAKIVSVDDVNNTPLRSKESGELLVQGPQVMKGYHNNPEATSKTIQSNWIRTGDIGHYDCDGQFYITDRIKELIKVKGFQVAPAELEELLREHPNVLDAAVIGIKHSTFGEVPKAFVVLKPNCRSSPTDITKYIASKVTTYKQLLGGVTVLNSIPRTASGKILRRQLQEL